MTTEHSHEEILARLDRVIELLEDIRGVRRATYEPVATGGIVKSPTGPIISETGCVPAVLSPGEWMIASPNGLLHIRGAYDGQPTQATEIDLTDLDNEGIKQ